MGQSSTSADRVNIVAFPRIHITLIGMGVSGYRLNGGIGFAIEQPVLDLEFVADRQFNLLDERTISLSQDGVFRLTEAIRQAEERFNFKKSVQVKIRGEIRTHFGFGVGTTIRLACLEALFIVNGHQFNPLLLQELSGRGRTSGIGINTYFDGGLVFDLGHAGSHGELRPSHAKEFRGTLPLLFKQSKMPLWDIGVCIPKNINPIDEKEEEAFFAKTCPIPQKEVFETLYHATYGLQAAALENDKVTFSQALNAIQNSTWKSAERRLYGKKLINIETALYDCGAYAIGMSSLGPTLFFMADDITCVAEKMEKLNLHCDIINTIPCNRGRLVTYA